APTQIPNRPFIARNSVKLVARLSANHARPVTAAPVTIIFFGLIRSASHPISGPAAPPVIHPAESTTERRARPAEVVEDWHEENRAAVDAAPDEEHRRENRAHDDPSVPFLRRHTALAR